MCSMAPVQPTRPGPPNTPEHLLRSMGDEYQTDDEPDDEQTQILLQHGPVFPPAPLSGMCTIPQRARLPVGAALSAGQLP